MSKRKTTEEFIADAIKVHEKGYDYSKVEYNGNKIKVCITCPKHGEFWQRPNDHLMNHGCPKCKNENISKRNTLDGNHFIENAIKVHGDKYNYSKIEYIHSKEKVCIVCPKHGEFWQTPNSHLTGYECAQCGFDKLSDLGTSCTSEFIDKAMIRHGNIYKYTKTSYKNARTKVCIICTKHGEFWQSADNHLQGQGCPSCSESKGERCIAKILDSRNIKFVREHRFDDCRDKMPLPFDFRLDNGILIEYDGKQHFKINEFFGGEDGFKLTQHHDQIKNEYCEKKGLTLIRIPYTMKPELIEEIILRLLP